MKPYLRGAVFVLVLAGLSACGGQKGAKLQKSVIPADKTLFQTGNDFMNKSRFIDARLAYQLLIRTYPDSELLPDAYFAMGDSYYKEGGIEGLLMAENQYKDFVTFFPTSPRVVDAQLKIISIKMHEMNSPDRDTKGAQEAEAEIRRFLQQYPNSDYIPIVRQWLDNVQENEATSDMNVGDFYAKYRANPWGASGRYKDVIDSYPHYVRMDEALFKYAQQMQKIENTAEAASALTQLVAGWPFSKYWADGKAELQKMGKPIPEVNAQLAAQNQALVKAPVPFSPLKPLIDFAEAIGFKGPPDRYEEARRIIAANKAEAVAAAEALKAGQAGGKPGEILITGTIERGPDGKPVAGSNPKKTPPATDKKGEKKQDDKTTATTKKK